jgi:anthranilate phosphoribosyltransferase
MVEGVEKARAALASGAAKTRLAQLVKMSNQPSNPV